MLDMHEPLPPQSPFQRLSLLFSAGWTRGVSLVAFRHVWRHGGLPEAITMSSRLICLIGTKGKWEIERTHNRL